MGLCPDKTLYPGWNFEFLYKFLSDRGFVIYPGKLAKADSFRLGSIGRIYPEDCENLMCVMREAFERMNIKLPLESEVDKDASTMREALQNRSSKSPSKSKGAKDDWVFNR